MCAAPCELACRRGAIDEPIAIRALKRFVCERFGVEPARRTPTRAAAPHAPRREERVAIVGAGPAGLACAHDLATFGYRPVVFEAQDRAGGMMVLGIPPYRLRRDLIDAEIQAILDLGVELRTGQALGRDFSLGSLRADGFAAVFLGMGATRARELQIPGVELDGVLNAVDFLLNANLGYEVQLGEDVIVVGGGNVALDAARTALRDIASAASPARPRCRRCDDGGARCRADREASRRPSGPRDRAREPQRDAGARVRDRGSRGRGDRDHSVGAARNGSSGTDQVSGLETIEVASVFDETRSIQPDRSCRAPRTS